MRGSYHSGLHYSVLSYVCDLVGSLQPLPYLPLHFLSLLPPHPACPQPASKQAILPLLEKHKASLPPPKSAKAKASSLGKEKTEAKEPSDSSPPAAAKETKTGKAGKTASKTGSKKGTGKKGKEAEEDFGPPLMKGPTMQQRQKDEQSFKVSSVFDVQYEGG